MFVSRALSTSKRGERIPFVVTAIVLIEAERSAIAKLGPALADVPGVAEAYSVTGEFDFVVIVRVKNHEEIADVDLTAVASARHCEDPHTRRLQGLLEARPRGDVQRGITGS